ncbi:transglutaminase domain-containing protein [Arcobacter sp. LA11]|uniref:transglutaminase domain-containing protein n=1 Tax=Arcobacter sp. LA11 TaxID=1898176 RepID=UPI00093544B4|nr:transglutaminase domain-containing protein [Arcobacter sp. LA11]
MLFKSKIAYYMSIVVSVLSVVFIGFLIYKSFFIVKNQYIDIDGLTYVNQVRTDDYTKKLAKNLTKDCQTKVCEVQSMLNLVTNIPYKINESVARSGKNVLEQNFGDCDDKSNLLISLLNAKGYEAYFVLVPKHIFVVVNLGIILPNKKALYINGKPFYKLESTAKNSSIGFPLKYKFDEIKAFIDPFKNKKLVVNRLEYK